MNILQCPVCGEALELREKAAVCANRHSFDRARQGYFNLLCSHQSAAKHHGDDKLMVAARRAFLEKGYYAPLLEALADAAQKARADVCTVLDAGCGDGYYTQGVCAALCRAGRTPRAVALDISREAVKAASARRLPGVSIVASAYAIPVADSSCDLLLNVFSPWAGEEFSRVLKGDGLLLRAVPDERHLYGLKQAVYDRPYLNPPVERELPGFRLLDSRQVRGVLELRSREDIDNLFKMTPYYYKTGRSDQQKLEAMERLTTEIAFVLLTYAKRDGVA